MNVWARAIAGTANGVIVAAVRIAVLRFMGHSRVD
jgi:hypothetical protein